MSTTGPIDRTTVRAHIAEMLGLPLDEITDDSELVSAGLDSLSTMTLATRWRRAGLDVAFADLVELTTFGQWWALLSTRRGPTGAPARSGPATPDDPDDDAPFALAPMQHAYQVGRTPGRRLGGVPAHFYQEFDGTDVEPDRLRAAVAAVLARHGMLRAAVSDDGTARILPDSPWRGPTVTDLRAAAPQEVARALERIRTRLSHRNLDIAAGETFDVGLTLLPGGATRVHVNLDMVAADAMSLRILMADLARAYEEPDTAASPPGYSFPRYLADRARAASDPSRHAPQDADREYWRARLPDLPGSPELPTVPEARRATVVRRHRWLDPDAVAAFEAGARRHALTPALALTAVFAEVLTAFGGDRFLLNVPLFDREPLHPDVDELVGDFTSSILLEWDGSPDPHGRDAFAHRAGRLQDRFRADAAHSGFSGLQVLRELSRHHGEQVLAPVVHTSAIGLGELYSDAVRRCFGRAAWIVSQGPQVHLDAQVTEVDGGLLVNWDSREDAFVPGALDAVFDAYGELLDLLVGDAQAWDRPPPSMAARVRPDGGPGVTGLRLHDTFFARAAERGDAPALRWGLDDAVGTLSHGELADRALALAGRLRAAGIGRGATVGLARSRGPELVVDLLGVLAAGATYLPVGPDVPPERRRRISTAAGADLVLDGSTELPAAAALSAPVTGSPDDLAYVLYTSGTTGEPKGVEMGHAAAANTVVDLNARFGVGPDDRALALSALEFDLSVYDLFGPLAAGGSVVLPDPAQRRDADAWVRLATAHGVTVLNCVPALLDMLLSATAGAGLPLRVVLLGGDRVGAELAPRTWAVAPRCRVAGLGGTTETAIHSTVFEVTEPLPEGTAVPYGVPLTGVACRVVDPLGRERPDGVAGELWIGGAGVAAGYRGDPERTADRFVARDGLRWYRTGDRARYRADGVLEFLGRDDRQVKIRGHRIELGEIEAALGAVAGVGAAVAAVLEGSRVAAVVVPDRAPSPTAAPVVLRDLTPAADSDQQDVVVDALLAALLTGPVSGPVERLWRARLAQAPVPEPWSAAQDAAAGTWLAPVAAACTARFAELQAMAGGAADPLVLLDDDVLAPDALLLALPDTAAALDAIVAVIDERATALGRRVRVAELGGRSGRASAALLERIGPDRVEWLLLDPSPALLASARARLGDQVRTRRTVDGPVDADLHHAFDVVVAVGSLHTRRDVAAGPAEAALLLDADGVLVALELPRLPSLGLLSAALLDRGFSDLDDARRTAGSPTLDEPSWVRVLAAAGFGGIATSSGGQVAVLAARAPGRRIDPAALREQPAKVLPTVMVPDPVLVVPALPLSGNGKIDRGAVGAWLAAAAGGGPRDRPRTPPDGAVEQRVAAVWSELLGGTVVHREDDLFAVGGDSLVATRMVARLRADGLDGVSLAALFAHPVLADFAATLAPVRAPSAVREPVPDLAHRHEPFPATDVQWAYWVGRGPGLELGGVGTHVYSEFDGPRIDVARFERAWDRLVARHEMLRAVFDDEGRQRILADVGRVAIPQLQAPGPDGPGLAQLRADMSHQLLDTASWPLFDVRAVHYPGPDGAPRTRLGISLDNIVVDGLSMMIVFSELDTLYTDPDADLDGPRGPIGLSFRDYVLQTAPAADELAESRRYWDERVPELPPAPTLPMRLDPAALDRPTFVRRTTVLEPVAWTALVERARADGITPSTVLLGVYTEALAAWSGRRDGTVTLTLFDRREVHPDVRRVVGDFTTLLICAYRPEPGDGWGAALRRLQRQVWADLDHRDVSAIEVLRSMARAQGAGRAGVPVVFTSALGVHPDIGMLRRASYGERVHTLSQTPQVWLDLQVQETEAGLEVALDSVDDLFVDGVPDAFFDALRTALHALPDADWDAPIPPMLPVAQREVRRGLARTGDPHPPGLLHAGFFDHAAAEPDRPALLGDGVRVTYGELAARALGVAGRIRAAGVGVGEPVVVCLPKGVDQIAAVLGVLAAGAVYVPIGVDQPAPRRAAMIRGVGARLALDGTGQIDGPPLRAPVLGDPQRAAYVIHTSGSTGPPKGVEVSHAAARNTIDEVSRRWEVGPDDRVLAVSALDFDLSVYDVFGLLGVGGALVLVAEDDRRDARRWCRLVAEHGVTVWNTVPVLLDMVLVASDPPPATLRLALVSGDWVPLDLPARLRSASASARFVALGGATEAAIWSNALEVDEVPSGWTSIPYGFALRGQRYRVVDDRGRDCPDRVPGELWIGGAGVATGYRGEPELTARRFVTDSAGKRWYRTGDLGRYWPDGTLEFLGRADTQVKIRGHRVELGEIEAALLAHPDVAEAVVVAVGTRHQRRLAGFVVGGPSACRGLGEHLAARLPAHAVPGTLTPIDAVPLTANGKLDRAALVRRAEDHHDLADDDGGTPPHDGTEATLAALWGELLDAPVRGRDQNVFALGADSLTATRLVERLRRGPGIEVALRQVFAAPTVAALAATIDAAAIGARYPEMEEGVL